MTEKLLLKPAEAADAISVSKTTLYGLIEDGKIPIVKVGSDMRVPVSGLNAWIKSQQKVGQVRAMTVADRVAEPFALDEFALRERILSVEEDCEIYRLIAVSALDALHLLTRRHDRLRDECDRLRQELRWLREDSLLRAGADEDAP